MKIIMLILAGLSAFMLGVLAAILKQRRRNREAFAQGTVRRHRDGSAERINLEYRNFLNYDGSQQN